MTARKTTAKVSDLVLDGFLLRSKTTIVRYPDRCVDQRGVEMWNRVVADTAP
jgi:hypothetical protein